MYTERVHIFAKQSTRNVNPREEEEMIPYGRRLIALRGKESQAEVAKKVGIAASTLAMYEAEQRVPRDPIKIKLAEYFNKTVQEIFYEPELKM